MRRRPLLAAPLAVLPLSATRAQGFPDRPVRYIVPFPPAGLTDIMARLIGQKLSERWGKPVLIENKAGGNALIGADAVAKAAPDGHTLLAITLTHAVNASLFPNAPYDFLRDLRVVAMLGSLPLVLVVRSDFTVKTLADLVDLVKRRNTSAGSSGIGTPSHLGIELLRLQAGAGDKITHVPYRGGAPALTDLVGGTLDFMVANLPEALPHIQGGRLRGLAVTDGERHKLLPDVPTTAEAGMPALIASNWTALAVPAQVPDALARRIGEDAVAVLHDPETTRRAEEMGFTVLAAGPDDSARFAATEVARWRELVAEAAIRAE